MPSLLPFRAVRPTRDKVHLVASRSYVSYTALQLRSKLTENAFSCLHIIHPDMTATNLHKTVDLRERFKQVRGEYEEFLAQGILQRDETPSLYIYRQIKAGHAFPGIIGAVSVDPHAEVMRTRWPVSSIPSFSRRAHSEGGKAAPA